MNVPNPNTAATDAAEPAAAADDTIIMRDKASGREITITPEQTAAMVKWRIEKEREDAKRLKYWTDSLELVRTACDSAALLTDIRANGGLEEIAASMAGHAFEVDAQILFSELVQKSGVLDGLFDADFVIFQIWEEACKAPGDWRWLVKHVRALEAATVGGEPPKPGAADNPPVGDAVVLVRASDVKLKKYDWLWDGYLVRGKFHVVAGAPSGGKTTAMLKLCAIVSSGGTWPDGTQAKKGKVMIWSSEDDIDDTLAPRLQVMGADMDNIVFIRAVKDAISGTLRPFDPATDMVALRRAVKQMSDVSLILVDPVVSAVAGDSHKNAEVRRGLQPLVDLAMECGSALVGISHFSKGTSGRDPVDRVTGSLAFGALARVVFAVAKRVDEESGETERIFVRAKSNIGPSDGGFKFAIDQAHLPPPHDDMAASTVTWGDQLEGSARDLLKEAEGAGESSSKTEDAAELIQETIRTKGGEASANDLHAALKAAGIGENSRYRAIKGLLEQHRIARVRYVENGPWTYIFPRRGGVADVSAFDPVANDSAANGDLVDGVAS